ncbi:MAG: hypothetical protein ACTSXL_06035 [Alphaproteobacteria bacterium]
MIKIEKYKGLADSLFRVSLEADLLKNNSRMDVVFDKLIADTDEAYLQIIKFIRGFQEGTSDAENMRETINIVENVTKDNYKEHKFPMPLDKILNSMMEIAEDFNELNNEAEGDFKEEIRNLYKDFHSVFVKIHQYQEQLKKA